jgi:hypothetical protein
MTTLMQRIVDSTMTLDLSEYSSIQIKRGVVERQTWTEGRLSAISLAGYFVAALRQDGQQIDADRLWLDVFEPTIRDASLAAETAVDDRTWWVPLEVVAISAVRWLNGVGRMAGLIGDEHEEKTLQLYWEGKDLPATTKVIGALESVAREFIIEASHKGSWGLNPEFIGTVQEAHERGESREQIMARGHAMLMGLKPVR